MKFLSNREWALLALILFYSFIPTFGGLLRVAELLGGSAIIPENPRAIAEPLPIILHILGSFIFCLVGATQFLPSLRRRRVGWHRTMGKLVAATGGASALTGLWMTVVFTFPVETQGILLYWVRITLSISMFGLIIWAIKLVRAGNVAKHSSAMLRAYAIGQGASTQACLGIAWVLLTGTDPTGLTRDLVMIFAWCTNLLVAEILIFRMSLATPPNIANGPNILKLPKPVMER